MNPGGSALRGRRCSSGIFAPSTPRAQVVHPPQSPWADHGLHDSAHRRPSGPRADGRRRIIGRAGRRDRSTRRRGHDHAARRGPRLIWDRRPIDGNDLICPCRSSDLAQGGGRRAECQDDYRAPRARRVSGARAARRDPDIPRARSRSCGGGSLDEMLQNEWLWIVDPIDGRRILRVICPCRSSRIGVAQGGAPQGAVVFDPWRDELYEAWRGGGATLNGERCRRRRTPRRRSRRRR